MEMRIRNDIVIGLEVASDFIIIIFYYYFLEIVMNIKKRKICVWLYSKNTCSLYETINNG